MYYQIKYNWDSGRLKFGKLDHWPGKAGSQNNDNNDNNSNTNNWYQVRLCNLGSLMRLVSDITLWSEADIIGQNQLEHDLVNDCL